MALASSLCLTILTIICTITRISGINTGRTVKSIDSIWETYWQYVAANIALTMTAATAFRTFFVSQGREGVPQPKHTWSSAGRKLLQYVTTLRSWRLKSGVENSEDCGKPVIPVPLRQSIPRGTFTGVGTFINGQGRTDAETSIITHTEDGEQFEDQRPLFASGRYASHIRVTQNITQQIDRAS